MTTRSSISSSPSPPPANSQVSSERGRRGSRRTGWLGFALRDVAIFFAVFAAGTLLEMAVYKSLSGDALYRFSAVAETHNTHGDVTEVHSVIEYAKVIYWNLGGVAAAAARPLRDCAENIRAPAALPPTARYAPSHQACGRSPG